MWGLGRILGVRNKNLSFVAGLSLAIVGVLSVAVLSMGQASAATGTDNDIIKGGFSTAKEFIADVRANNNKVNSTKDLQAIYAKYGLSSADYDNFAAHAVPGKVTNTGDVTVNGVVVATGALGFGRQRFESSDKPVTIPGAGTYYTGTTANRFAAGVKELPVFVLLNAQGQFVFAVMTDCGNPVIAIAKVTSAACTALNASPVADKPSTYTFSAAALVKGNAAITKFVYDFGDGTSKTATTGAAFTHAYAKAAVYNATVTVFASVPGNSNLQLPAVNSCAKQIAIAAVQCVQLTTGAIVDQQQMKFSLVVTGKVVVGSAKLTSADFDFGDGHTLPGAKPDSSGNTVTTVYQYATPATYNITAVLHFTDANGQSITAPTCAAVVTATTPPTPECKPGVPVGSPECVPPCQPGSSTPPESAECTPPTLPKTGAGNTVAIFSGVMIVGLLVYRQLIFRKHKAAFAAAQMGFSPLPLADPLNSDAPLAGTPLDPRRRRTSFRRRRP